MTSIKIRAVFGKYTSVFNLKILTVAEENKIRESVFGLTEKERDEKSFDRMVSALSEFSVENVIFTDEDGKEKSVKCEDYFKTQTPVRERIAHYVFNSWIISLSPTIDFL